MLIDLRVYLSVGYAVNWGRAVWVRAPPPPTGLSAEKHNLPHACTSGNPNHSSWFKKENSSLSQLIYWRFDVDLDHVVVEVEEAAHQRRPLNDERTDQEVEADTGETVAFEERHQIAEPDEHHDVNVLKHCNPWRNDVSFSQSKSVVNSRLHEICRHWRIIRLCLWVPK